MFVVGCKQSVHQLELVVRGSHSPFACSNIGRGIDSVVIVGQHVSKSSVARMGYCSQAFPTQY